MPVSQIPNPRLLHVDLTTDATVISTGSETVQLKPPEGFIYRLVALWINIPDPVGSGSGTHSLWMKNTSMDAGFKNMYISSNTGADLLATYGVLSGTVVQPSAAQQQQDMIATIWASNSEPFDFAYTNSTDVSQTGTREIDCLVLMCREAV